MAQKSFLQEFTIVDYVGELTFVAEDAINCQPVITENEISLDTPTTNGSSGSVTIKALDENGNSIATLKKSFEVSNNQVTETITAGADKYRGKVRLRRAT